MLVPKDGELRSVWTVEVKGVNDRVAESEISGEDVARNGGEKKVKEDWPSGPNRSTWPGLDDGPPEEESSNQKGGLL